MSAPRAPVRAPAVGAGRVWLVRTLLGSLLLLGFSAGFGSRAALPWAEQTLRDKLTARAAAAGLQLQIGALRIAPFDQLRVEDVSVRLADAERPFAALELAEVDFDVHGVWSPRVFLQEVRLRGGALYLTRDEEGQVALEQVVRTLLQGGDAPTETGRSGGSGGLRRFVSPHMPRVVAEELMLGVDDEAGGPLTTPGGLDLRHLRLRDASLRLENTSPVREVQRLELSAATRLDGVDGELRVEGVWAPDGDEGFVSVGFPAGMAVQSRGVSVELGGLTVHRDRRVVLRKLHVSRGSSAAAAGSERPAEDALALDVRELAVHLRDAPGQLPELPTMVRERLPDAALRALAWVDRVVAQEPVIVGRRRTSAARQASAAAGRTATEDGDERENENGDGDEAGDADEADVAPRPDKPPAKRRKDRPRDGSVVREALAKMATRSSDRVEAAIARLGKVLSALPVRRVELRHGRARYRDESSGAPGSGDGRDLSDFDVVVERKPDTAVVTLDLDFAVKGVGRERNSVQARFDTSTGDGEVKLELDRLPLAPWASLLPASVHPRGDAAIEGAKAEVLYEGGKRLLTLDGGVQVRGVDVDAPAISRFVLEDLDARLQGRLVADLASGRVDIEDAEVVTGKLHVLFAGQVANYRTAPHLDGSIRVPTLECQELVDSLPTGLVTTLDGLRCRGRLSLRVGLGLDTADMKSLKFEFEPVLQDVEITDMGRHVRFDVLRGPFQQRARQPDDELYSFVTGPGSERWVEPAQIADCMAQVLTTTEDGSFFSHHGFSLRQIKNAMIANLERGYFARGASTMSQQLVKNLFFVEREKTIARKLQEAVITWQMEQELEKHEILGLYLNVIEFGPRIYGVKAAATHYFNRAPADLSLLQCIWLGSIVPNPRKYYRYFADGELSEHWREHLCWIGRIMLKREKITPEVQERLGRCDVVFGAGRDSTDGPAPGSLPTLMDDGAFGELPPGATDDREPGAIAPSHEELGGALAPLPGLTPRPDTAPKPGAAPKPNLAPRHEPTSPPPPPPTGP